MVDPDVEKNRLLAVLGYILPILFFVPLITEGKNSPYARFHANQQLVLLIVSVSLNLLGTMIPVIGWFLILPAGFVFVIILVIFGATSAWRGEMKRLPLVGSAELIR